MIPHKKRESDTMPYIKYSHLGVKVGGIKSGGLKNVDTVEYGVATCSYLLNCSEYRGREISLGEFADIIKKNIGASPRRDAVIDALKSNEAKENLLKDVVELYNKLWLSEYYSPLVNVGGDWLADVAGLGSGRGRGVLVSSGEDGGVVISGQGLPTVAVSMDMIKKMLGRVGEWNYLSIVAFTASAIAAYLYSADEWGTHRMYGGVAGECLTKDDPLYMINVVGEIVEYKGGLKFTAKIVDVDGIVCGYSEVLFDGGKCRWVSDRVKIRYAPINMSGKLRSTAYDRPLQWIDLNSD